MNKIKAKDIMNEIKSPDDIISVNIDDDVKTAVQKIVQNKIHRIVVKRNNIPEKILRITDIDPKHINIQIRQIFNQLDNVNIVSLDDDVEKVVSSDTNPVSIVYNKSSPVGIITPSDISKYLNKQQL